MRLLQERRNEIIRIAAQHGALNIRVFGSIYFLINYDLEKITPWFPAGLLMDLQDLLGYRVYIVTEKGLSPLIKDRILESAKPL